MKKYYIKNEVVTQAERMADKYACMASEADTKAMEQGVSVNDAYDLFDKAIEYKNKEAEIREALSSLSGAGTYQAHWSTIRKLIDAAAERTRLDMELEIERNISR